MSQSGVVNLDLAGCPSLCEGGCDELRAADSGSRAGCASLSDSLGMITVAEDADGDSARDAACVLREMLVMPVGSFASGGGGFAVDDEDGADGSARGGGLCGWWPLRVEVSTKMSSFWQAVLKALAALLPNSFFDFLQ